MKKYIRWTTMLAILAGVNISTAFAEPLSIPIYAVDATGTGKLLGKVYVTENPHGLIFTPELAGLPPGTHGFHIHENPSCAPGIGPKGPAAGLAAGGHWDPQKTKRHAGPYSDHGHLGDLPALYAGADGRATYPVLAPRLKSLKEIRGRALTVHLDGDNHSDNPAPLGGGGARLACGVIPGAS